MLIVTSEYDDAVEYMAKTIWGEARGEPIDDEDGFAERQAVGEVIWNRAKHDYNKVKDVCLKPHQFTCWNKNDPNFPKLLELKRGEDVYEQCMAVAYLVMTDTLDPVVPEATHYHTISKPPRVRIWPPKWAARLTKVGLVGGHIFYK